MFLVIWAICEKEQTNNSQLDQCYVWATCLRKQQARLTFHRAHSLHHGMFTWVQFHLFQMSKYRPPAAILNPDYGHYAHHIASVNQKTVEWTWFRFKSWRYTLYPFQNLEFLFSLFLPFNFVVESLTQFWLAEKGFQFSCNATANYKCFLIGWKHKRI